MRAAASFTALAALCCGSLAAANGGDAIGSGPYVQPDRWTHGNDSRAFAGSHTQYWRLRLAENDRVTVVWREGRHVKLTLVIYPGGTTDDPFNSLPRPIAVSAPRTGKGGRLAFTARTRGVWPIAFLTPEAFENLRRPGAYRFVVQLKHAP